MLLLTNCQAGAVAAFTVDLLVYPLDTIKTRYQSQEYLGQPTAGKGSSRSLFRGLYQGIGSVVIATLPAGEFSIEHCTPGQDERRKLTSGAPIPQAGVFFLTYETSKSAFGAALPPALPQPFVHSLASGCAELASCVVLTPAEVIKQNAQVLRESGSHRGSTSLQALRVLRHCEGGLARKLWSGYTALAARNLPFTALHFPMFEFFRGRLWEQRHRQKETRAAHSRRAQQPTNSADSHQTLRSAEAMSGPLIEVGTVTGGAAAMSGAAAAFITTPTDVVKTRMMLAADTSASDGSARQPLGRDASGFQVAKNIFHKKGIRGLFRGAGLRIAWTALGSGLYLGSYEMAKFWLKGDGLDNEQV